MLIINVPLRDIYKDAAQPAVRNIGKFLGALTELVTVPLTLRCRQNVEAFALKLGVKLENIPEEYRQIPKTDIAVPILERSRYTSEEEIQELYAEILAKSLDKRYSGKILPRYQEIVASLSPVEAKILQKMKTRYRVSIPTSDLVQLFQEEFLPPDFKITKPETAYPMPGIPFLEVRDRHSGKTKGYTPIYRIFVDREKIVPGTDVPTKEFSKYFYNLSALGLVDIQLDAWYLPLSVYDHLEKNTLIRDVEENMRLDRELELVKGKIYLTELGEKFLEIALKSDEGQNEDKNTK